MELLADPSLWAAFLTLTALEIVLGIDNIIFISILTGRLPPDQQRRGRDLCLTLAMLMRIGLLFSLTWRLLPSSGMLTPAHFIMPVITLGTAGAGSIARFARSSMLDVLNRPYMRTAQSKGLRRARRIAWHAVPNAAIPVVTLLGFRLGDMIAGSVVVEAVFAWPGVGRLLVNAVTARELAIVQAIIVLVTLTMVTANFLVDLLYGWLDPRQRSRSARDGS